MFKSIIYAVLSLGIMGLLFGVLLAYASKIFAIKVDERIPQITEVLPGANCGGCGFAGCSAFATAVVNGEGKINGCPVGGAAVAQKIANIMGVEAQTSERMVARVMCCGTEDKAKKKYNYVGIDDCVSVMRLAGGDKFCSFGCTGLGTCVAKCPFDAISIVNGIAVIDKEKCTACKICIDVCPKKVIALVPYNSTVFVDCMNKDKGIEAKNKCDVACIACKICEKNCPSDAIKVENNVASIDYSKCTACGICVEKCPRKCINLNK